MQARTRHLILAAAAALVPVTSAFAAPYVSGVTIIETNVSFILNEDADALTLSVNGGSPIPLNPTRGAQAFSLPSPTDTFTLTATKTTTSGWSIPTGGTVAPPTSEIFGLSQPTAESGFAAISDDTNVLNRFQSPRGMSVNRNPNAGSLFGTAYISNSAIGTFAGGNGTTQPLGPNRSLGDGLYAVKADQSDGFSYGDTAQTGNITIWAGPALSGNAPYRLTVGPDNKVYIADFSDATGSVYVLEPNLTGGGNVLPGSGGPFPPPTGQNHGSTTAVYTEGSLAAGNLVLYTLDEDLTTAFITGEGSSTDRNSLWRYDIGSGPLDNVIVPTKVNANNVLLPAATSDMTRGKVDGKFYLAQTRSNGTIQVNDTSLVVLNPDGTTAFSSLTASRDLLGDPAARDILKNVVAIDVSDDQKWIALMLNGSDVVVIPLVNGIPDIANRLIVNTGPDINSGRDISFDAANNIHYVSSGQLVYRVLSPGGTMTGVTSWDGSNFSFTLNPAVTPSFVLGDFNFDGGVDASDIDPFVVAANEGDPFAGYIASVQQAFGLLYPGQTLTADIINQIGDFNGDGGVDASDIDPFVIFANNGGAVSAIPEPAALGLLAPLGLLLSRRRRA